MKPSAAKRKVKRLVSKAKRNAKNLPPGIAPVVRIPREVAIAAGMMQDPSWSHRRHGVIQHAKD